MWFPATKKQYGELRDYLQRDSRQIFHFLGADPARLDQNVEVSREKIKREVWGKQNTKVL